ncbi:MAG: acylneuraminate cytidylyltransferase family protein [bacterium]|nr:acylneuraminate cytidylyltransferase family protein [bacterium]
MEKDVKIIGIIPARGGSKSIPHKNIVDLGGKPLIAHTIEMAKKSKLLDAFIVSTDDEKIAEVARKYGADVPFLRPKELAEDKTPDLPVFQHAMTWLKENRGWNPEILVHLRPTTPFKTAEDIDGLLSHMIQGKYDSARSTHLWTGKSPYKSMLKGEDGVTLKPLLVTEHYDRLGIDVPRQLLPDVFVINGVVDATRTHFIVSENKMWGPHMCGYDIPEERAIDIDGYDDLEKAKEYLKKF